MKGVHFDKARNKWEATARRNGKRIFRIRFDTEEEANDAMEKFNDILRQGGLDALNWDSNAFTEWKSAKEILNGGSVIEAALFYKKHASMVSEKKTVSDAVNEFLEEKKKMRSEYHYKDLHSRLKMVFCSSFGTYICPDVKTDEIRRFLLSRGNAPRTIINNSRVISSFFNWCVRRKYCSFNPCNDIHESDLPEDMGGRIGILTPDELKILFECVKESSERSLAKRKPDWSAWLAVQAFTGIRPHEAGRMKLSFVDTKKKHIWMPREIVKTNDDWLIDDVPDGLWKYIESIKRMDIPTIRQIGKIRKRWEAKTGRKYPNNALRHSFATYHLSLYRDAPRTSLVMRHRNPNMLWQSYLAKLVPVEEAKKWFEVV